MSLHPEYPNLVRDVLASDLYWQQPEMELPAESGPEDAAKVFKSIMDTIRVSKDGVTAHQIGSVLTALEVGGTIEPVAWGETVPIPHKRQVVKIVEDSREICSKASPLEWILNRSAARGEKRIQRDINPDYRRPSFGDDLASQYERPITFGPVAKTTVEYSRTKMAIVRRSVFYAKFDEESGMLAGLLSQYGRFPEIWDRANLELLPRTEVGTAYRKNMSGSHSGRIISAAMVEANSVVWKNNGKPSGNGKSERKSLKSLAPGLKPNTLSA